MTEPYCIFETKIWGECRYIHQSFDFQPQRIILHIDSSRQDSSLSIGRIVGEMEPEHVIALTEPAGRERHTRANLVAADSRTDNAATGLIESDDQCQRIGLIIDVALKREIVVRFL